MCVFPEDGVRRGRVRLVTTGLLLHLGTGSGAYVHSRLTLSMSLKPVETLIKPCLIQKKSFV